ncbi:NmrA family NAD(P)-binding protein [Paenibacillus humicola]|uniref:NmrA family NAD(P)-binding protein n=1 Tax=Paenibacillus humicola TaxID=3110540 RepID=UPI00237B9B67|nr:NmrA family NAD(P)-binding protein [Paenibacillus humicola]
MKKVLITAAAGDTGRPAVAALLEKGFQVRALVRRDDARAQKLRDLGAEVMIGDMTSLRDIRAAMAGMQLAYFCYPVQEGLVENAVIFAQAAKEQNLELIVNMSQKQSRPYAHSKTTQNHWLSEQVFNWSGVPTVHLRVTFFMEWLLYISSKIKYGRYMMPFNRENRFAPLAAKDTGAIIAGMMEHPEKYAGQAIALHGPVEYSHEQLAAEVSRVLGKDLPYERVTVSVFLEAIGLQDQTALRKHIEAVTIDQQEGLLAGLDPIGAAILGRPLTTVEAFIHENRSAFELHYPMKSS